MDLSITVEASKLAPTGKKISAGELFLNGTMMVPEVGDIGGKG
jgi:hypothetical protein